MSTNNIDNGKRVDAEFGRWRGKAGVAVLRGETQVAFAAPLRSLKGVETGTVDGVPVKVLSADKSAFVPGMVVLKVEAVAGG